jgi:paraquat-inducible protein B
VLSLNNKTFLITRPGHDLITNYLLHWSRQLIDLADSKGMKVIDLEQEKVNRKGLASRLNKIKPELVMLNGHGNKNKITGYDNQSLLDTRNARVLSGTITYARSCSSAHTLGDIAVQRGAKAYIGYVQPFTMGYDINKIQHPLEDKVAALFLEPSNHVVTSLLKGHTAGESTSRSKKLSMKRIQKLASSTASAEEKIYARYLWYNMQSQVCLGDQNATI